MAHCDVCRNYCHLACHDPPLKRLPKKSKYKLWQCSFCDKSSSSEDDTMAVAAEESAPGQRPQRNKRKRRMSFAYDDSNMYWNSGDEEANEAFYASLDGNEALLQQSGGRAGVQGVGGRGRGKGRCRGTRRGRGRTAPQCSSGPKADPAARHGR